jgi:16S rRNA (cytidine1402-2'-O)-methyltransferase
MKLFVVPTPVGNLGDMTYRAVQVLQSVDCILCEDTRTSGVLLKHYSISTPSRSFHQHNEHHNTPKIVDEIQAGKTFAIISDAGTPGISDAAFLLIRACVQAEIIVDCLPGATALIPAVVASAIPCDTFSYLGFLPQKKGRHTLLSTFATHPYTIVFYESPHRLTKTLVELCKYLPVHTQVCVAREISKKFEEYKRGTLEELSAHYTQHQIKGEIVVILESTAGK